MRGYTQPTGDQLWAGAYIAEEWNARKRAYLAFDTSALEGKTITDARLNLRNTASYGCGDTSSGIIAQQRPCSHVCARIASSDRFRLRRASRSDCAANIRIRLRCSGSSTSTGPSVSGNHSCAPRFLSTFASCQI